MRPFLLSSSFLVLAAGVVSGATCGIAGYAWGVHTAQRPGAAPEHRVAAAPVPRADADVLTAAPSWLRWPQLTDF